MRFEKSFWEPEVRWDFLVTEDMKKVWAAEMELLEELDRVCRDNGLTYYADYGTLLGVVRHQGFIPWDDDIDVSMFREDYEKLKQIAPRVLREPFEYQDGYSGEKMNCFAKLRNRNTTAIQDVTLSDQYNQGIFIDIFPLDDGKDEEGNYDEEIEIEKELWMCMTNPSNMLRRIREGEGFHVKPEILTAFCQASTVDCLRELEGFLLQNTGKSKRVNLFTSEIRNPGNGPLRSYYDEIVYLPFETMQLPCPGQYREVLQCRYGNYMTPVKNASCHNGIIMNADRPYTEYLALLRNRSHILF